MTFTINPKTIFKKLLFIILILLILNLIDTYYRVYLGHTVAFSRILAYFNLGYENNIPTLYATLSLFLSSLLLLIIGLKNNNKKIKSFQWVGLSIVFLFLGMDEMFQIHEKFNGIVGGKIETTGFLYYGWVIPYFILTFIFLIIYLKFLMALEPRIRKLFILSGAIFVVGAIGLEMIAANYMYSNNTDTTDINVFLFGTVEEVLEMLGIALFIYTLLTYIKSQFNSISLKFES
jgi:hypothetical protein